VLGIPTADDPDDALTLDHFAVLTDRLDAAAYFHKSSYGRANSPARFAEPLFEGSLGKYRLRDMKSTGADPKLVDTDDDRYWDATQEDHEYEDCADPGPTAIDDRRLIADCGL